MDYNVEIFKKYLSPVLGVFLAFSAVVEGKVKELRFEGALRLVGATQLLGAMKKDPGAFKRLVDDPKLILKYFMDALKTGFSHFKDNFGTHFKNAIFGWLFGKAAEMGIQMPKEFNVAGLFHLIAQLIGVTYRQIRSQVVAHLGPKGESIVSTMEKAVDILKDLITRGPIALWEHVKSFLSDLKEMIFSKISELVTVEIIKAAVLKLISMLNPVGAIVQLVLGIYRVVKFFIDRWDTIKQLTNAILDSITNVALGNIGAAADYIEQTMAKGITLIISFLAGILGLGGIVEKVKSLIKKISDPVQAAIAKVVNWILEKGKALLAKLFLEVKAGVSKLPAWWKKKVPIVGDDEPHTLYFKGEEDAAELMVASSPRRLENFVSDARANSEITGNAKKNAALDKVEAEIPVLRKIRAALRPLKDAPEDKRKPHLDKLDASFGKIGTELEIILAGSKSGTEAAPILIPWPKPAYTAYPQLSLYNQGSKDKPKWKLSAKKKPGTPAATYSPDGGHSAAAGTPGELQTLGIKPPFQLTPGMTIGPLSDASTPGGGKINSILERYGWDATGEYMDGDHVVEIQFGGKDRLANLWPLDASVNRGAGSKLSRQQVDLDGQKITIDWLKKAKKKPGKETKKYYFKVSGVV